MYNKEHLVTADTEGNFYCRAVDAVLNCHENQQVCGIGCPCFIAAETVAGKDGCFVCLYEGERSDEGAPLFPSVQGLDERLAKAYRFAANVRKYRILHTLLRQRTIVCSLRMILRLFRRRFFMIQSKIRL